MINYSAENNDYLPLWAGFGKNGPSGGYKSRSSSGFPDVATTLFQNAGYGAASPTDLGSNIGALIRCNYLGNLNWPVQGNQNTAQNDSTWEQEGKDFNTNQADSMFGPVHPPYACRPSLITAIASGPSRRRLRLECLGIDHPQRCKFANA